MLIEYAFSIIFSDSIDKYRSVMYLLFSPVTSVQLVGIKSEVVKTSQVTVDPQQLFRA